MNVKRSKTRKRKGSHSGTLLLSRIGRPTYRLGQLRWVLAALAIVVLTIIASGLWFGRFIGTLLQEGL